MPILGNLVLYFWPTHCPNILQAASCHQNICGKIAHSFRLQAACNNAHYTGCVLVPAYDTCYHKEDLGASYRGRVNFTSKGPCDPWVNHVFFNPQQYVSLQYVIEDNLCTSVGIWRNSPMCETQGKTICNIPECTGKVLFCFTS